MARLQQGVAAVLNKELFTAAEVLAQVRRGLGAHQTAGRRGTAARPAGHGLHPRALYRVVLAGQALAAAVGLNERYLTACFHQETGITPIAYLTRYRIQQAKVLLEAGQLSVTDVGLATGFSDGGCWAACSRRKSASPLAPTAAAYEPSRRNSSNRATRKFLSYKTDAATCGEIEAAKLIGAAGGCDHRMCLMTTMCLIGEADPFLARLLERFGSASH